MSDRLLDADSVAQEHTTGTLNTSLTSDLSLMGELQMIQDVLKTVSSKYSQTCEQYPFKGGSEHGLREGLNMA
jgi:hypothetical protein